ncbi:MAG: AraC family transcriptional regulator [Aurantibacter sp.]
MNPIYENIDVSINASLKVVTYTHSKTCATTNWHIHPEYELVYVRNGSGKLRIGSKTTSYSNGVLLFLGPNIPHADFGNKEFSDNFEVVVQFTKKFVEEKLSVFPEFKKLKKLIQISARGTVFDGTIKNELSHVFERFDSINEPQKLINLFLILEKLSNTNQYKTILLEKNLLSRKAADVNRLETIFQYVNEHYKEHIRIEKLAAHLGLTQNSFCRFFKKMTHQTFVQFVNEFRIRKAVEIFNENQIAISEAMYLCGFSDPSYFTKQFKKYQGTTPSKYLLQDR